MHELYSRRCGQLLREVYLIYYNILFLIWRIIINKRPLGRCTNSLTSLKTLCSTKQLKSTNWNHNLLFSSLYKVEILLCNQLYFDFIRPIHCIRSRESSLHYSSIPFVLLMENVYLASKAKSENHMLIIWPDMTDIHFKYYLWRRKYFLKDNQGIWLQQKIFL